MPRKIVRKMRIDEISAVDRPAQAGARFTLMKRAGDTSAHDDNPVTKETPMDGKKYEDMTDAEKAIHDKLKKADEDAAALAKAHQVIALKADQRAHFDGLTGDAADAFLAKSADERSTIIAKSAEADAVVYTCKADGRELRKSDGEVAISMAKRMDEQAETIAKMAADRDHDTLLKRADAELPNLGGTNVTRAALLKSVGTLPDTERDAVMQTLKAADAMAKQATTSLGINPGTSVTKSASDAKSQFEGKVAEIAKRDGVSEHVAYSKAADEFPDLVKSMDAA